MYCNHCGKVIQDDAAVCAYCGVRVGSSLARRKLMRPRLGRKIAGVCLGFSEYFDIDVTLVRVELVGPDDPGVREVTDPPVSPFSPLKARRKLGEDEDAK